MEKAPRAVLVALIGLVWVTGCMSPSPALPSAGSAEPSAPEACEDVDLRTPTGRGFSLTGRWRSPDGGTYYLRQARSCVWFAGFSRDTGAPGGEGTVDWTNSYFGNLASDFTLRGSWADLPWGDDEGVGILDWRLEFAEVDGEQALTLEVIEVSGGFFGQFFVRPDEQADLVVSLQDTEDCAALTTADGQDYELLVLPPGWAVTTPPGLVGPDGEEIGPAESFEISGEVARGNGDCGPGRLLFADQIEASTSP